MQASEECRRAQADAHSALLAEAAELNGQLATAEAAALLARQQAADNQSFSCIRESLSNQVSALSRHNFHDLSHSRYTGIHAASHCMDMALFS